MQTDINLNVLKLSALTINIIDKGRFNVILQDIVFSTVSVPDSVQSMIYNCGKQSHVSIVAAKLWMNQNNNGTEIRLKVHKCTWLIHSCHLRRCWLNRCPAPVWSTTQWPWDVLENECILFYYVSRKLPAASCNWFWRCPTGKSAEIWKDNEGIMSRLKTCLGSFLGTALDFPESCNI